MNAPPSAPLELRQATDLALAIREQLAPLCLKIEIAGSVRRARPFVNDLDFVLIPGDTAAVRARITARAAIVSDGPQILIVRLKNGLQCDFYFAHDGTRDLLDATPSNWGSVLLCRTGSREHNIHLCQRAQSLDLHWDPPRGLFRCSVEPAAQPSGHRPDTTLLASATEEDIFAALNLDFVPPVARER